MNAPQSSNLVSNLRKLDKSCTDYNIKKTCSQAADEIERLQRAITAAMELISNGHMESAVRVLRECFWRPAPESRDG